ncbi:MAG: ATP-binding protein [Candidatus Woesearchaeota archaeon]
MISEEIFAQKIEKRVFDTIKNYKLIEKNDKVLVALSGGKDSMSLLEILSKKFTVEAAFIDLGIKDFSEESLKRIKEFCNYKKVTLKIFNLKEELGFSISEITEIIKKLNMNTCNTCGVLKRYLLNKKSKFYDKLATGHNLDDEISSIFMNIFKANIRANASLGPKTGVLVDKKFVQRIKPLYFCTNEEIKKYALIKKIPFFDQKCPLREGAFRVFVSEEINKLIQTNEKFNDAKQKIIKSYLKYLKPKSLESLKKQKLEINYCSECGEPSSKTICNACRIIKLIRENFSKEK